MGCVCGKPSAIEDSRESPRDRFGNKISSEIWVPRVMSSRREVYRVKTQPDNSNNNESVSTLIDKQINGSNRLPTENFERKRDKSEIVVSVHHPSIRSVPRASEGEQVAAGWPPWLAAVAGEAIKGWVPRRADSFEKLDKGKIVALKKVRFDNLEPESVQFMAREIHILRRLNHPNVIKLEGLVTSRMSCSLYLVFEGLLLTLPLNSQNHSDHDAEVEPDDVWFNYPSRPRHMVLEGINLKLRTGLIVALVGPSGGGKVGLNSDVPVDV